MPEAMTEFGYIFFADKNGQTIKIEGSIRLPDLESARDSVRLFMMRDSRITQAFLVDHKTKARLWAAIPGILREEVTRAGFGPQVLDFGTRARG
jgi:hypothetical protein